MASKYESRDWMAALGQLREARPPGGVPAPTPLSSDEWQKREQFKVKVIEARVKLKLMRDRTDALKQALARYREKEEARRA
jgi:hypothetical protein